ncbi:ribosome maturation factor RimP [Kocuria massiliensis]|uniref:ribosome maturation factor RimP n=1 Tax=Kocuria massiliensis TaxID=1926282 RepID=UPI0022B98B46|nr:ribosome maturation factor RimP [Kocuria massiliensis]
MANTSSNSSARGKSPSRERRRLAREKANASYSDQAHPRNHLADSVSLEEIRATLRPVAEEFGLVIEEVTARGAGKSQTLTIVVDLQEDEVGSVALDTISEVSGAMSEAMDTVDNDPEEAYFLEVTSPGATRKLVEPRHWKRSRGRLISVKTVAGESFVARLEDTDGSRATIAKRVETPKGVPEKYRDPEEIDLADVATARVELEFNH